MQWFWEQSLILTKKCCTEGNTGKKRSRRWRKRWDKNGKKKKKVKMKCSILRMTEVHTLLFQFKFFYSLNISCAISFIFRNYVFRNPDVTLRVCPRSNFPLKQKILHADISSVTFPDAWQSCLLAEGMKNFIHNVTILQSSKEIKCRHFFLWTSF